MFKNTHTILSALGLGLSVSCATPPGPDIRAAAGLANAVQFHTESLPADAPPAGNTLDLPAAVERAVRQSPPLQVALAEVRAAQADARQSRRLLNPVLNVVFRQPNGGGSTVIETGLSADFLSVLQTPRRIRAADNQLRAASARAIGAALDVIADTEKSYHTANALRQEVALLEQGAAHTDRLLQLARRRLDAGEGTRLDLATLEARRAETRIDLQERRLQLTRERLTLARLLGQPSGETAWQQSTPLPVAAPAGPEADWLAAALRNRPEIQADRWQLAALGDARALARLALFEGSAAGLDAEREGDWSLGPSLAVPLPLFDWGQARRAKARALAIAARHRLTQTVRRTVQEVRQAHAAQARLAAAAAQAREQLTPRQRQRVELARAVYESGQSEITPLLLAELDLQKAQLRTVQLELRAALASTELRRASGGAAAIFKTTTNSQKQ
ncbi:MAG: TolC family protein [Verrucomicrobia bacterium]|nr:TolC family protein [Verrucomicrobiota bacterium]